MEIDVTFVNEEGIETKKTMIAKRVQPLVSTHTNDKLKKLVRELAIFMTSPFGELIGTFLLTLVICSVVSSAVLSGAQIGLWQVAVVCGLGVAISIYSVSHICDAHLNPAITIAFALLRYKAFSWKKIIPYIIFQLLGGILAGTVLYSFNSDAISLYEEENGIERGTNASVISAMMFGEYFPNPSLYSHLNEENLKVASLLKALAVEAWTTSILAFVIFSLTDKTNTTIGQENQKVMAPLMIGLTVAILISIYGHLTQVGMNPARDFGPRLVAASAGWGLVAIPGPRNGFWVYILGPLLGGVLGAALNDLVLSKLVKL